MFIEPHFESMVYSHLPRVELPEFLSCSACGASSRPKFIELKREMVNGTEWTVWNPALSLPAQDFGFSGVETARIKGAIQTWDSYTANADRRWLKPLVETLFLTGPQK